MKIVVLAVGKLKDKRISSLAEEYLGRIRPQGIVSVERTPDVSSGSVWDKMEREAQELLRRLRPRDRLILLREDGMKLESKAFADLLSEEMETAPGRIVFAIGGPWGTADSVKIRADKGLSLSAMTFPHEMCFLFLTEQLYRAFSILQGTGYHH